MPPTTGFQYTPPSYLVRASDRTNRPWSKTEEGGHDNEYTGENEYDLPQEDRPQTKRQSHLDAHFQQRVRNKQSRYHNILNGEAELPEHSNAEDDEDDSILAAAKNADSYALASIHSAKLNVKSATSNQKARKTRKERISGITEPRSSTSASSAENARNLRAHRLRHSLLKQTADEFDVQNKLEMRRLARRDEEAVDRKAKRDAKKNDPTFEKDTIISKSKALEKKRMAKEAEREVKALAKEEAAVALLRAAELNEERIRQRDREQLLEQYRVEEERMNRKNKNYKKKGSRKGKMRTKDYGNDTDGDTFMTEFDAENDFAFLHDLSGIIRDSGILKSCGNCFGAVTADDEDGNSFLKEKADKACSAISSVFVPDLSPSSDTSASDDGANMNMNDSESIRRSREYARYRE